MTSAVGIVIGLASRAPLTLFDEPYLGLDAVARQLFYDRLLADYADHPRTVVLSTHLIEEIAGLLERVLLHRPRAAGARRRRRVAARQRGHGHRTGRAGAGVRPAARGAAHRVARRTQPGRRPDPSAAPDRSAATAAGLALEPTNLQQLVVAMSLRESPPPRCTSGSADDLEEVS